MVKPTKYFLKQADKAESLLAMARAYRSRAQIFKTQKKAGKEMSHANGGADAAAAIIHMHELL